MTIVMEMKDKQLIVKNNLRPKAQADSTRLGINNLKEKYRMLNSPVPIFEKGETEFTVVLPVFINALPS